MAKLTYEEEMERYEPNRNSKYRQHNWKREENSLLSGARAKMKKFYAKNSRSSCYNNDDDDCHWQIYGWHKFNAVDYVTDPLYACMDINIYHDSFVSHHGSNCDSLQPWDPTSCNYDPDFFRH